MLDDLFLLSDKFSVSDFDKKREACIVELIAKMPTLALDIVFKRLRSKECGIGERIRIIVMLGLSADRLAEMQKEQTLKEEEEEQEKKADRVRYLYIEEVNGAEEFERIQLREQLKAERIKEKTRVFASSSRGPSRGFQNRFLKHSDQFIFATLYHVSQADFAPFLSLTDSDKVLSEYILSSSLQTLGKFLKHSQNALNIKEKVVSVWRFVYSIFKSGIDPGRQTFELQTGLLALLVEIRHALKPHLLETYPDELEELSTQCQGIVRNLQIQSLHENVRKVANALQF